VAGDQVRSLFFICRHGETALNLSGFYRGWSNGPDAHLNANGIKSAQEIGQFLQKLGQKFSVIISSPLERAQLTAAIVARYLNIKTIQLDDRLMPLNVGELAGKPKEDHPIGAYLKDKNKRFPGGETVNEFEKRQYEFAIELLPIIEKEKNPDDAEVLVVAHVSNIMYWWNAQTGAKSEEYLDESTDIVGPGGIALITENTTLPVFKENESQQHDQIDSPSVKGELGTGYEDGEGKGPFSCQNCEYFRDDSCGQKDMMAKSKRPRTSGGRVVVEPAGCCDYVERLEIKK